MRQTYENGYITYMRTDSTIMSHDFINIGKSYVESKYGDKFVPRVQLDSKKF